MLLFLGKVIFMREAFLLGDFMDQFYPWSMAYSEAIKNLQFPFWIRYMQSGFPLMAEGQIGGFYPLNIIMFFLLPFKVAYNYSVILHFMLGGVFAYLYSRRIGSCQWGGALSALIFCFGSAYAGAFYNMVTLRTLVWFPLVLLLVEKYFDTKKPIYIVYAGLIAGMQFLAGFLQLAAYSFLFYLIYMLYSFRLKRIKLREGVSTVFLFSIVAFLVSSPQLFLSYQLAQESGRVSATLGFALWGSFKPPCFLSAFFPNWLSLLGQQIYIGIFSLLFLMYAIKKVKDLPQIKPLILLAVVAILLALGKYLPLYPLILRLTGFYSFRNPSKLLFFDLFSGSILAGLGFTKIFQSGNFKDIKKTAGMFSVMLAGALAALFSARVVFYFFKNNLIYWVQAYTQKYVVGKPYHRYGFDEYMLKAESICNELIRGASFNNIFMLFSIAMILAALIAGIFIYLNPRRLKYLKSMIVFIIVLDLWVYGFYGTGFTCTAPFSYADPENVKILNILKSDKSLFRIVPFAIQQEPMPGWARPNANMAHKLDSIAAYTPLSQKQYKERLLSLEVVDDSLGLALPDNEALAKEYQLLRLLNVKYIVTARELTYKFLKKITEEDGVFLYELKGYLPRAFFTYSLDENIKKASVEGLQILDYRNGFIEIDLSVQREGFLVFSENYYPGWKVFIDDREENIIKVQNIVQAVKIDKGTHTVIFKYSVFARAAQQPEAI